MLFFSLQTAHCPGHSSTPVPPTSGLKISLQTSCLCSNITSFLNKMQESFQPPRSEADPVLPHKLVSPLLTTDQSRLPLGPSHSNQVTGSQPPVLCASPLTSNQARFFLLAIACYPGLWHLRSCPSPRSPWGFVEIRSLSMSLFPVNFHPGLQ